MVKAIVWNTGAERSLPGESFLQNFNYPKHRCSVIGTLSSPYWTKYSTNHSWWLNTFCPSLKWPSKCLNTPRLSNLSCLQPFTLSMYKLWVFIIDIVHIIIIVLFFYWLHHIILSRFRYTYGKPVKGEATVSVYPEYYSDLIQPIYQNPLRKVVPINGKTVVQFDVVKDLRFVSN